MTHEGDPRPMTDIRTDEHHAEFNVDLADTNGLCLVLERFQTGSVVAYVIAPSDREVLALLRLDTPTRGTESTLPAEQDPDAHTDGTTAQEPTQPLKPWAQLKHWHRDGKTVCLHLEPTTQDDPGFHFTLPNQSKITNPEQVAATIGSLASRKGGLVGLLAGRSDHDVVSVELLRRVLADTEQMIDVEDLASLRRKAAMLPVVLLWRDATANALDRLATAVKAARLDSGDLVGAYKLAREVLTVDPEKAYGFAGPVDLIVELDRLRALVGDEDAGGPDWRPCTRAEAIRQAEEARTAMLRWLTEHDARRDERDEAREQVATLEDLRLRGEQKLADVQANARQYALDTEERIARLEAESTRWKTRLVDETARLRGHLTKLRAERPRIWWPGDPQPEDVTRITTGTNREEMRLHPDGLWRPADAPAYPSNGMDWADMMANEGPLVDSAPSPAITDSAPRAEDQAVTGGKTTLATIRIEFDPATRALLERAQTVVTGGIIPDVAGVLRDAQFEVLRAAQRQARPNTAPVVGSDQAWYRAITHASPRCACGINDAGQRYIDLICRPAGPTVDRDQPISCDS